MKTLKQLRGILETPVEQDDSILVGKFPKQPLEEDVEKRKKENPFEWSVIVPVLDKFSKIKKNLLWVIDDKNKFLPSTRMLSLRSNVTYVIAILVWLPIIFYTYKHDNSSSHYLYYTIPT